MQGSPSWSNVPDICSWTDTSAARQREKHEDLMEHHQKEDVKERKAFMSSCKLVKPQKMRFLKFSGTHGHDVLILISSFERSLSVLQWGCDANRVARSLLSFFVSTPLLDDNDPQHGSCEHHYQSTVVPQKT